MPARAASRSRSSAGLEERSLPGARVGPAGARRDAARRARRRQIDRRAERPRFTIPARGRGGLYPRPARRATNDGPRSGRRPLLVGGHCACSETSRRRSFAAASTAEVSWPLRKGGARRARSTGAPPGECATTRLGPTGVPAMIEKSVQTAARDRHRSNLPTAARSSSSARAGGPSRLLLGDRAQRRYGDLLVDDSSTGCSRAARSDFNSTPLREIDRPRPTLARFSSPCFAGRARPPSG